MSGPILTVGPAVITEMVRLAAFEVPGVARVGRGGPRWRALSGRPFGHGSAATRSRCASGSWPGRVSRCTSSQRRSVPRSLRPSSGCSVSSWGASPSSSMASGADRARGRRHGRRLALASIFEADFGQRTASAVLERHLAEGERDETVATLAREIVAAVGDTASRSTS